MATSEQQTEELPSAIEINLAYLEHETAQYREATRLGNFVLARALMDGKIDPILDDLLQLGFGTPLNIELGSE